MVYLHYVLELHKFVVDVRDSRGNLECVKQVSAMREVGEGFPCGIMKRVALPFHEVLSSRAMVTLLENRFHLIFWFTMNDDGWRERVRLAGCMEGGGVFVREEFAHMEHVVDAHVGR